jgi:hypothetical protein
MFRGILKIMTMISGWRANKNWPDVYEKLIHAPKIQNLLIYPSRSRAIFGLVPTGSSK